MCYNAPVSRKALAIAAVVITTIVWGSAFAATKVAVVDFHPMTLAAVRFAIASAILVPLAALQWRRSSYPGGVPWAMLALLGLTGVTLFYATFNLGMAETTATKGSLIHGMIPAVTAFLAMVVLGERLTVLNGVGISLSVVGVAVIVAVGDPNLVGGPTRGDWLMVMSALIWCLFTIIGKRVDQRLPSLVITAGYSVFGTLFLIPFAVWELETAPLPPITPIGLLSLAYLALASSAAGFLLWTFSLNHLPASQVGVFMNLVPVAGVAAGILLLQEALLTTQVAGGVLVLLGVYLANRQPPSAESRPQLDRR